MSDPAPPAPASKRLLSKSFIGFLVTQGFGAINDSMFRWLIVPIAKFRVAEKTGNPDLEAVVMKALELSPARRYSDAGAMADPAAASTQSALPPLPPLPQHGGQCGETGRPLRSELRHELAA